MQHFVLSAKFEPKHALLLTFALQNAIIVKMHLSNFFPSNPLCESIMCIAFLVPLRRDLGCWPAGQGLPRPPGGRRLRGPELAAGPAHICV